MQGYTGMIKDKLLKVTFFNPKHSESYMQNDWVYDLVLPTQDENELSKNFICNQWLINNPAKRMIFSHIYFDLFKKNTKKLKILDIGAGVNFSQRLIAQNHSLTVIDILAHDNYKAALEYYKKHDITLINADWFEVIDDLDRYDIIIANDIFPNADQRLIEFLQKTKNKYDNLRLMLTHYSETRAYKVKRFNGDEVMFLRAWDETNIINALEATIEGFDINLSEKFKNHKFSIFPNGRHCSFLNLKV